MYYHSDSCLQLESPARREAAREHSPRCVPDPIPGPGAEPGPRGEYDGRSLRTHGAPSTIRVLYTINAVLVRPAEDSVIISLHRVMSQLCQPTSLKGHSKGSPGPEANGGWC